MYFLYLKDKIKEIPEEDVQNHPFLYKYLSPSSYIKKGGNSRKLEIGDTLINCIDFRNPHDRFFIRYPTLVGILMWVPYDKIIDFVNNPTQEQICNSLPVDYRRELESKFIYALDTFPTYYDEDEITKFNLIGYDIDPFTQLKTIIKFLDKSEESLTLDQYEICIFLANLYALCISNVIDNTKLLPNRKLIVSPYSIYEFLNDEKGIRILAADDNDKVIFNYNKRKHSFTFFTKYLGYNRCIATLRILLIRAILTVNKVKLEILPANYAPLLRMLFNEDLSNYNNSVTVSKRSNKLNDNRNIINSIKSCYTYLKNSSRIEEQDIRTALIIILLLKPKLQILRNFFTSLMKLKTKANTRRYEVNIPTIDPDIIINVLSEYHKQLYLEVFSELLTKQF